MLKIKNLLLCSLAPIVLSGCATMILMNEHPYKSSGTKTGIALEDTLIAIGTAKSPIQGFENAVVVVGEKYSYLAQPAAKYTKQTDLFQKILHEVDLNYLKVGQFKSLGMAEDGQHINYSLEQKIKVTMKDSKNTKHKTLQDEIGFIFYKPLKQLTQGEESKMQALGFQCEYIQQNLRCSRQILIDLYVANPVRNQQQLAHKFNHPIKLEVEYNIEQFNYKQVAGKALLMPLAITFDVVTSPLQLVGYMALESAF